MHSFLKEKAKKYGCNVYDLSINLDDTLNQIDIYNPRGFDNMHLETVKL